jgi:hypothetical protein
MLSVPVARTSPLTLPLRMTLPLNEHVPTTSEPSVMKAADASGALRW